MLPVKYFNWSRMTLEGGKHPVRIAGRAGSGESPFLFPCSIVAAPETTRLLGRRNQTKFFLRGSDYTRSKLHEKSWNEAQARPAVTFLYLLQFQPTTNRTLRLHSFHIWGFAAPLKYVANCEDICYGLLHCFSS